MILAELQATVAVVAATAYGLPATVRQDDPGGLPVDVGLDLTVPAAAVPRGTDQVAGFLVRVGGADLDSTRVASVEVERGFDLVQRWEVVLDLPSQLGAPDYHLGAPPGKLAVDLYGVYLTSTGQRLVPLITNGRVDNAEARRSESGERTTRAEGGDAAARYDRRRATLTLPPGHGLGRGAVVSRLAAAASVPSRTTYVGGRMDHGLQIRDEPWLPLARELAAVDGRTVLFGRDGVLQSPVNGYDAARPVDLEVDDADLTGAVSVGSSADVVTRVTVTGSAQVTREDCALRTEPLRVEGYADFAPRRAAFAQGSDGSLAATGLSALASALRLVSVVESRREFRCDTLISESELTWGWYNPQVARYVQDDMGTISYPSSSPDGAVYLLDPGATADDDSPAYAWLVDHFVLTGRSETTYRYDERGMLIERVQRLDFPHHRAAAIKVRTAGQSWEEASYINGGRLLGNRSGVVDLSESLPRRPVLGAIQPKRTERTLWEVSDEGYISAETREVYEYFAPRGSLYLYAGGEERSQAAETFGLREVERVDYLAEESTGTHAEIRVRTVEGVVVEKEIRRGLDGHLPAAERDLNIVPPASLFDSPEEAEAARAASRLESQEVGASWVSWRLETRHEINEAQVIARWAQTPEECQAVARRTVREGAALPVSLTLAGANFLVEPGWRLRVRGTVVELVRRADGAALDLADYVDVFVRRVKWRLAGPDGPLLTDVSGRYYPVVE